MNQVELVRRVRKLTRDVNSNIFLDTDIQDFVNEAIERVTQVIDELRNMTTLKLPLEEVILMPKTYHHLLALYGASRCFTQDERHYQASNLMNEFEFKLQELRNKILNGELVIVDADGLPITFKYTEDYVRNNYFLNRNNFVDVDNGVEGVN